MICSQTLIAAAIVGGLLVAGGSWLRAFLANKYARRRVRQRPALQERPAKGRGPTEGPPAPTIPTARPPE
jgi:hypothetical protein